ncbi:ABC transporter permease [Rhodococcus chondri]|uniref:ABC transporter permease n=1 Tax=Rhodococcus chondri TaxID=3065941 RepID=A0ABU7JYQ2_9NOCA|nr:ABC transporter permease [Rhodococcus sp. CC-R104]MEE2035020.1 ABC transporter permease [Rhodococcus sp. CC-R104]
MTSGSAIAVDSPEPAGTDPLPATPPAKPRARFRARGRKRRNTGVLFASGWIALIVLAAVFADFLPLAEPDAIGSQTSMRPFTSLQHLLGTDILGRDLLSRSIFGARVSLAVALGATTLAVVIGGTLGIVAGYVRGWTETGFEIVMNSILAFPPLIFLIAIVAALQPGIGTLVLGLALVAVPSFARIARATTLSLTSKEFVLAAKTLGASPWRIMARELLPNVVIPVLSFALVMAATLVVAEGSLSFLGLGIPPPAPSWGGMIAEAQYKLADHPHLVLVPAVFFFLTVFSLNKLGDWATAKIGKESAL